jgi:hypothetical protein
LAKFSRKQLVGNSTVSFVRKVGQEREREREKEKKNPNERI